MQFTHLTLCDGDGNIIVGEDCYFATDEVENKTNSHKRCMIYWWYATNIYSICGKRVRMQLPDCLVNAVRRAYPEASGQYEGFSFGAE